LILDESTTKVVSSVLTMFDIMEQNVSLVENLDLNRQSFPDMDAVYFISPTMKSARRVMADFVSAARARELPPVDGKPASPVSRYGSVHLIFSGSVSSYCCLKLLFNVNNKFSP
jgi:syntaxin-binding protein 1